jgi:C1A family cysteine protease
MFLDKYGNNLKVDNYNYEEKFEIFSTNFKQSLIFNEENGINGIEVSSPFLDMTSEEFKKTYLNLKVQDLSTLKENSIGHLSRASNIPDSFNWVDKDVVNDVRNQGSCGSCWAFSSCGNIEGQYALKHSKKVVFAPQQLVDCDRAHDAGCYGGFMEDAFKYLESNGLEQETDYQYTAKDGTCKYSETKGVAKVLGYKFAASDNEDEIAEMLVATGPLALL